MENPNYRTRRQWLAATGVAALSACSTKPATAYTITESSERLGGEKALILKRTGFTAGGPVITEVEILPGRGFNIWQLRAMLPGKGLTNLITAPPLAEAAKFMDGREGDYRGNESFKNGGAILLPYANRIRGKFYQASRTVETMIGGKARKLPANWKGKLPGAELHSMHGLILDLPVKVTLKQATDESAVVEAQIAATDFGGFWPSQASVVFRGELNAKGFTLQITTRNAGAESLPLGVGWHPYFQLPSGDRKQAKLKIPAATRALVDNYDNVFPTGATEATAGSKFDFRQPRAMGDQFLDDCFMDLIRDADGSVTAEIQDPAAKLAIRATSQSKAVKAFQCYAPPDKSFLVLEPQYNIGDPFNQAIWKGRDTGMVLLGPGESSTYDATLSVAALAP